MAENPLLLTIMALILYHDNSLPRDRPLLYERILDLLLGQWDKVKEGQSLAEAIGLEDWDSNRLRPLLDQLSYQAHTSSSSKDGRGRLKKSAVRDGLITFFETARVREPWGAARRCLEYIEQRSGLLIPDGPDSYVFAHLTLQEHCAARHMLLAPNATELVLQNRGDDRWREPIFLGLGVIQRTNPALIDRVLSDLIDKFEGYQLKPSKRWQQDLLLAAEIGNDRDWNYLRTQRVNVERLQRELRQGFIELLADPSQPLPTRDRIRAALFLGEIGDSRFPVTLNDWLQEIQRALNKDNGGYFCRVPAGKYSVGSNEDDTSAKAVEKPRRVISIVDDFYIARYPITLAQWQVWLNSGGLKPLISNPDAQSNTNLPVVGIAASLGL